MAQSLHALNHKLASTARQLEVLEDGIFSTDSLPSFREKIGFFGHETLRPGETEILQLNVGYMCNQTCKHCHVDAGPDRKEIMTRETMEHCIAYAKESGVHTVDITGGAPEMNPDFLWLVKRLKEAGVEEIIVRSNLTILVANEKKFGDLPEFFREHGLRVVSSLPFYLPEKTDRQRGEGVFAKSIEALQRLNQVGYGREEHLIIDLVYNPSGAFLPAAQSELEADFKRELKSHYDIDFNSLLTITNLPISRFLEFLIRTDNYEDYMDTLVTSFNLATLDGLMCRNTLSIGWDGQLYDCDFNQMLELNIDHPIKHIKDLMNGSIANRNIVINNHCYGCTAGAGSSCQGSVI